MLNLFLFVVQSFSLIYYFTANIFSRKIKENVSIDIVEKIGELFTSKKANIYCCYCSKEKKLDLF